MIEPVLLGMVLGFVVATIGGLFVAAWIQYKRENEIDAIRLRPHPYEFALYYDI